MSDFKDLNRSAANVVLPVAKSLAPVRTGRLAASVRTGATMSAGIVRAGNNRKSAAGVPYGGVIHWGWPARGIRANTFVLDAAKLTEPAWVELYFRRMSDIIQKVEGK